MRRRVAMEGVRASFIVRDGAAAPGRFDALRRFVPVAALTALVVPALLPKDGEPAYGRALAVILAALVAWRTRNVLVTVIVGLATLLTTTAVVP